MFIEGLNFTVEAANTAFLQANRQPIFSGPRGNLYNASRASTGTNYKYGDLQFDVDRHNTAFLFP